MAGFDLAVNGKVDTRNWTVPNIMVAFAVAHKTASILAQDISDLFLVLHHYADIPTLFSNWKFSLFAEGW